MLTAYRFFFLSFFDFKIPATNNEIQELFLHVIFTLSILLHVKTIKNQVPLSLFSRVFYLSVLSSPGEDNNGCEPNSAIHTLDNVRLSAAKQKANPEAPKPHDLG